MADVFERYEWLCRKDMRGAGGEARGLLVLASIIVEQHAAQMAADGKCQHTRYSESPNGRVRQCSDCFLAWNTSNGPPR